MTPKHRKNTEPSIAHRELEVAHQRKIDDLTRRGIIQPTDQRSDGASFHRPARKGVLLQ